jgi:hypothetical protein
LQHLGCSSRCATPLFFRVYKVTCHSRILPSAVFQKHLYTGNKQWPARQDL